MRSGFTTSDGQLSLGSTVHKLPCVVELRSSKPWCDPMHKQRSSFYANGSFPHKLKPSRSDIGAFILPRSFQSRCPDQHWNALRSHCQQTAQSTGLPVPPDLSSPSYREDLCENTFPITCLRLDSSSFASEHFTCSCHNVRQQPFAHTRAS